MWKEEESQIEQRMSAPLFDLLCFNYQEGTVLYQSVINYTEVN